jgi:hypothetical protein
LYVRGAYLNHDAGLAVVHLLLHAEAYAQVDEQRLERMGDRRARSWQAERAALFPELTTGLLDAK